MLIGLSSIDDIGVTSVAVPVKNASSASFSTPVGYQTNLMVYGPGGYKFGDYIRAGLPLAIIFWIAAIFVLPLIWPV